MTDYVTFFNRSESVAKLILFSRIKNKALNWANNLHKMKHRLYLNYSSEGQKILSLKQTKVGF